MKENKNMKVYVTPMVEVMNARVEKGFAGSTTPVGMDGNPEPIHGEHEVSDFD